MNLLVKDAHVVSPQDGLDKKCDVLIEGGIIKKIGSGLTISDGETIDAKGLHLFPGLIDLHVHLREPGNEAKETIHTGSKAALRGGFVACVSMPNTLPACDNQGVIDIIIRKAKEVPFHIFPSGTISKGREGKELAEMGDLKNAGAIAVTDDGAWVMDSLLMRRAMEYASMLDLIVMSHCEDLSLSAGGVMNEGLTSTKLGLRGLPAAAEDVAVARDIELARLTGAHLHICHVSTARAVELIRRAKDEGIKVTGEVTPHHLALTDEFCEGYNTNSKMHPPLRREADIKALRQGLKDGVIDCVATDHAPHTQEEKMRDFDHAPVGVIGLETALAVVLTELHHGENWSLNDVVRIVSTRPAEILKKNDAFGCLVEGTEANLTLVDINHEWTVTKNDFDSKSRNSCFLNRKMKGKVRTTICAGTKWDFT